jgi:hypothetical protein
MPNTLHLLNQVRAQVPRHTDYAIAKALYMDQSQLQRVLAGKAGLGPKAVVRLSELLSRDVGDILVLVEEDKARRPKDREFWGARSPRITAAVATAALALGAAVTSKTVSASTAVWNYSIDNPAIYIMRTHLLDLASGIRNVINDIARRFRASQSAVTARGCAQPA